MILKLTPLSGNPHVILVNAAAVETVEPLPGGRGSVIQFIGRYRTPLQVRERPEDLVEFPQPNVPLDFPPKGKK